MGYKRIKKIYNLVFEDPEMKELEATARGTSMGGYLDITSRLAKLSQNKDLVPEDLASLDGLFDRFAKVLVSWNLEDDARECRRCGTRWFDLAEACPECDLKDWVTVEDAPVPTTKAGLLSQDPDLVMAIINAWAGAVGGVDADLGKDSNSGGTSLEASLPMAALSTSPGSSPRPN